MLFDDYEAYLEKYRGEYGPDTIILMQCGSFYELYDDGSKSTDLKAIGELLNIQVSRRNKAVVEVSRANLEMAGFPSYTLKKFIHTLVQHNYTCVIVSQTTSPPNPKREVTDIVSPGTYIDDELHTDSNYLMSIYAEEYDEFRTGKINIVIGASMVDLGTGKTYVFETSSKTNDLSYPLDEVYRLIVCYNPREFIICGKYKNQATSSITFDKLVTYLDIKHKCIHNEFSKGNGDLTKLQFQNEVLKKVYPSTGMISSVEFLNLERCPCARTSFVRLLQFVNAHNEQVLNKLHTPFVLEESNTLILSYNSIKQLDIIPNNMHSSGSTMCKTSSLFDILNNCKTAVGRRYFKERLFNPLISKKQLEQSYGNISLVLDNDLFAKMNDNLKDIYDLDRLFRKIDMNTIHPYELGYLITSLSKITNLCNEVGQHATSLDDCNMDTVVDALKHIMNSLAECLSIDELPKFNMDNISCTIFKQGTHSGMDELRMKLEMETSFISDLNTALNNMAAASQIGDCVFKVEFNERDGYYLLITNKRFQEFMKCNKTKSVVINERKIEICDLVSKPVSQSSTSVKVSIPCFKGITDTVELLTMKLRKIVTDLYKNYISTLSQVTCRHSSIITKFLAYADFYCCCAYNTDKYKYVRPIITDRYERKSFIDASALRHPIIERINDGVKYVTNDVALGAPGLDGILLYGLNSSGKSSLMKSIGIAVVMAQAGMYVACDHMEFYPYEYIFTRILSSDDIFKGQSTFTKEMMELRGILKRANSNSLVLGDELCSGTESISALSIVSAGVHTLALRKSSFIFATHLHDLVTIPIIKELSNVKTYHLSVEYDIIHKRLIYDRKLKEGNGSSLYGLEVCKSLDLDAEFLDLANTVRQGILGLSASIVSTNANQNKYNTRVYKDVCEVCRNKAAAEIHHISQQKDADAQGYIGSFHKNQKFNLVCLCEECHDKVHHGNLSIHGYQQTSDGVVLSYALLDNSNRNPGTEGNKTMVKDVEMANTQHDVALPELQTYVQQLLEHTPMIKRKDVIAAVTATVGAISSYKIDKVLRALRSA